jgi:hypothetical protein
VTDNLREDTLTPYDPASMAASSLLSVRAVWYKRPWFLITTTIVVVIAVSVLTDLPHHITSAEDATAQNSVLRQANKDIAPCAYAVKEAFSFYEKQAAGTLTASNLAQVKTLLPTDQTACSFAGGPVSDLTNNIQVLDTAAGKNIDLLLKSVVTWMTNDADAAILDIEYLISHPGDAKKLHDLSIQEGFLAKDRQAALNYLATARSVIGVSLTSPRLPVLPRLAGT